MKNFRKALAGLTVLAALCLPGCLIVAENHEEETQCYDDCYDYEVCETYCDSWDCWDECWWETSCTTTCDEVYVEEVVDYSYEPGCYNDYDCGEGQICVADACQPLDTDERGFGGLCQTCESNNDCIEPGALCIRLNFDQETRIGEKVCTRTCEINTDCPAGFECINISDEVGVQAQCLPVIDALDKRTCNSTPELECVKANDCALGESCVGNVCQGPNEAECDSNNPCANGLTCRDFECVDANAPECVDRADCRSGEICIDGACAASATSCVFSEECDGGLCVNGACATTCNADADCGSAERCRQGVCEAIECRRTSDCASGELCVDAQCENLCDANGACDAGYVCNGNNYCEADPNVACRSNAECGRDELCDAGKCITPCSCNQQCGSGEVCNLDNGTCEAPAAGPSAPSCANDCDCPSGQSCSAAGTCG